jgi:hypothetical protein
MSILFFMWHRSGIGRGVGRASVGASVGRRSGRRSGIGRASVGASVGRRSGRRSGGKCHKRALMRPHFCDAARQRGDAAMHAATRHSAAQHRDAAPQHAICRAAADPSDGKAHPPPMEKLTAGATPPMEKLTPPVEKLTPSDGKAHPPPMEKLTAGGRWPAPGGCPASSSSA